MLDLTNDKLLNPADLYKLGITYSRQHLWRLITAGRFPQPIRLTPRGRRYWLATEIHAWLRDRIAKSRGGSAPRASSAPLHRGA